MAQPTYLTSKGLKNLKAELEELRAQRRPMVAERIQKAKEIGGTVDNAEYDEAKNEQAFIEGRVRTLEVPGQQCCHHLRETGSFGCGPYRVESDRAQPEG